MRDVFFSDSSAILNLKLNHIGYCLHNKSSRHRSRKICFEGDFPHLKILFRIIIILHYNTIMEDTNEEYLLKWNSHHSELVAEFLDLCKVLYI